MPATALSRLGARVVEPMAKGPGHDFGEDVWARLEQVKDPRSPRGRIYPLACLLAIVLCALTAAGHDRLTGVGQWIARATPGELSRLRLPFDPMTGKFRVPDEKTIRTMLNRLEPGELTRAILGPRRRVRKAPDGSASKAVRSYRARRAKAQVKALARSRIQAVAVDGKSARGARRADGTRVHILGATSHDGRWLAQMEVDVKHNETTHFTTLLDPMDLEGSCVTFDALHTVRANLHWLVTQKKAHYIAVIKANHPLLLARVKALPWKDIPTTTTTRDHGHGRDETRTLKAAHVAGLALPHARQAIKITRWRQDAKTAKITRETVYAVTSLTSAQATSEDLARLVREHWTIEAAHHVRDTTFDEDRSTSRTGHGPLNLATIRNAITNALHDAGYLHIPEGRRDHTTIPETLYLHGLT